MTESPKFARLKVMFLAYQLKQIHSGRLIFAVEFSRQMQYSNDATSHLSSHLLWCVNKNYKCGPMPNVVAALPNIGGALCSTPQSLADAHCWSTVQ